MYCEKDLRRELADISVRPLALDPGFACLLEYSILIINVTVVIITDLVA